MSERTNKEIAKVLGLRLSELRQLQNYVEHSEQDGWYFSPKEQFDKRHENIKRALNMQNEEDE